MPPQFAALPLIVKSPSGVSGGATSMISLTNFDERGRLSKPVRARHQPLTGASSRRRRKERTHLMSVFVVDRDKRPLMPCSEKRARVLLGAGRAVVHRRMPFVIRLKDRRRSESVVQTVALKLDPGSHTTGMAVVRVEQVENTEQGGPRAVLEVHHALHLAELSHRGAAIHTRMEKRAGYRRRRRSANLRYRPSRFHNRRRKEGWLPPSLRSRILNVFTWAARYQRWVPLARIEVERVEFDLALMQNPEIEGVAYQHGELAGWECRAYLLEKFGRRCVYCGKQDVPFEVDHVCPRSRGGTDRIANLVLSCHECNQAKGNHTAAEFGYPEVEKLARAPLKDASAVNATRFALVERLDSLGLPIGTWSGGRTRWNRARFQVEKTHANDALCVGSIAGVEKGKGLTLTIEATGRGSHCRTNVDDSGFPRGYLTRQKRMWGG
jgi:5-methylcytosine-specific restriction endonuclease McrA